MGFESDWGRRDGRRRDGRSRVRVVFAKLMVYFCNDCFRVLLVELEVRYTVEELLLLL